MTLRWGIASAAKICHDFVNAFNSYPGDKGDQAIVAVAARDKSRATEFANIHNISKVFESYQALAESKDIDIVYIGVLNPQHYEVAKLFLENGKHVLCEKPLCMNFKQANSLVNLAKRNNLFLMEAVWSRFAPSYIALENEINAGKIGEARFVEVNFGIAIENIDRIKMKELGGSAVLDLGIYVLQFAQYIFKDEPIKVTAVGELNSEGVDKSETIILDYTGGRRAVLNVHTAVKLWNRAVVTGTKGSLSLDEPFHFSDKLTHVDGGVEEFPMYFGPIPYNFDNSPGLVFEAIEAYKCIKAGLIESPRMTHNESLLLAKLEDTVRNQIGVTYDVDSKEYS